MDQPLIIPTRVNELIQKNSRTSLFKGNKMDPILHTVLSVGLIYIAYRAGKLFGKQEGIDNTVAFLLHMGVCTKSDLQKANQQFEDDNF